MAPVHQTRRRLSDRLAALWRRDPREIAIALADDGTTVDVRRGGGPIGERELAQRVRRWGGLASLVLQVPVHRCLIRELTLPEQALTRADEVLALDLARTTPFRAGDVLTGWYRSSGGKPAEGVAVRQVIVKRTVVTPVLDVVARLGLPLKAIEVVVPGGEALPVDLLPAGAGRRAPLGVAVGRIAGWLLLAAIVAYAAATGTAWFTVGQALDSAEREQQAMTAEVQGLRRQVAAAEAGQALIRQPRLRKISGTPVLAVWEEVTRVLPQTTYLAELRIEGGAAQLDGFSANASELVALLAASPLFANVAFAAPVTRDTQRGLERFQIRMQVGGAAATPAGAKGAVK